MTLGAILEAGHSLFKELQRNQSMLVVLRAEDGFVLALEPFSWPVSEGHMQAMYGIGFCPVLDDVPPGVLLGSVAPISTPHGKVWNVQALLGEWTRAEIRGAGAVCDWIEGATWSRDHLLWDECWGLVRKEGTMECVLHWWLVDKSRAGRSIPAGDECVCEEADITSQIFDISRDEPLHELQILRACRPDKPVLAKQGAISLILCGTKCVAVVIFVSRELIE